MYEENLKPLPDGDFAGVFAQDLAAIERDCRPAPPERIAPASVLQWANTKIQPRLARICRRLLLPGSQLVGGENLAELTRLAAQGGSCLVCLNHRSNLDVPTLYALAEDQACLDMFQRLIWISGRKLEEDVGATRNLVQAFNRVIVSPRSWINEQHSAEELQEAHQINLAAHRAIHDLRHRGWVFALFPAATRIRPHDASTSHAIEETDSYLKSFEYLMLGRIDGCTLPVSRGRDLTHETPALDRVRYTFGPVLRTDAWRVAAAKRFATPEQRTASALAIMEDIANLDPSGPTATSESG